MSKNIFPELVYSVKIDGGLGDAVVIARAIRDLQKHLKYLFQFDIFFHNTEAGKLIFENIKGYRSCIAITDIKKIQLNYAFKIIANTYIYFHKNKINLEEKFILTPLIKKILSNANKYAIKNKKYIQNYPEFDGAYIDKNVTKNNKKFNSLHNTLGIKYGGHILKFSTSSKCLNFYKLKPYSYVTVHDGWDEYFKFISARPTKTIGTDNWTKIISNIKKQNPKLIIVQIGGKNGHSIPGVDLNLRNKISLIDSISILKYSKQHFDCESGLVHFASALGTKCSVAFGPTNYEWYSYPENINIKSNFCYNCNWVNSYWMSNCPLKFSPPLCMTSINYNSFSKLK